MKYPFKNLVFEGGGVKGIAYAGALESLEKKGILKNIEKVAGTSAGAIAAVLVGLGYSITELQNILLKLDFNKLLDFDKSPLGVVRDTARLLTRYGLASGDYFEDWMGDMILRKAGNRDITFADYEAMKKSHNFRSLYLVGTNVAKGVSEIYSLETTPYMKIVDAVRISMSILLAFSTKKNKEGDVCIDGGVLLNYPIRVFDYDLSKMPAKRALQQQINNQTLGFRLDSGAEIDMFTQHKFKKFPVNNIFDYLKRVLGMLIDNGDSTHLNSDDWKRTVYINTLNVGTVDFDLTLQDKQSLINSAKLGVENYFNWYDGAVL